MNPFLVKTNNYFGESPNIPLEVKEGDKVYFGLDIYGIVITISQRGNAIVWFDINSLVDTTVRLKDRNILSKKGVYLPSNRPIYTEAERNKLVEINKKEELESKIWCEIQEIVANEFVLHSFEDLKKVIQKHAEYLK